MQGAKAGLKGAVKAGAKALSKEALQQLGKASLRVLKKEVLEKGIKGLASKLKCFVVRACFKGDTQIQTPNGIILIKNLKVGDQVYSYDEKKEEVSFEKTDRLPEPIDLIDERNDAMQMHEIKEEPIKTDDKMNDNMI